MRGYGGQGCLFESLNHQLGKANRSRLENTSNLLEGSLNITADSY